jgi:Cu(I)-responsive transcriptional regulator
MNIGQTAKAAGVSAKMIRHYEAIGLIPKAARHASSGYREYSMSDVHRLCFVRRGRQLGFSIVHIRILLRLWSDRKRSDAAVRKVALDYIDELKNKASELRQMIATLRSLAKSCEKGDRPYCPVVSKSRGQRANPPSAKRRPRRRNSHQ